MPPFDEVVVLLLPVAVVDADEVSPSRRDVLLTSHDISLRSRSSMTSRWGGSREAELEVVAAEAVEGEASREDDDGDFE